ncbi:MAG: imidazole glycerol phosphate synthase subunit HisH [Actinomycetota bacterium]
MRVAVLDHGMGNLRSVAKSLEAAGADQVTVTSSHDEMYAAAALCVPGQGVFGRCMSNLRTTGSDGLVTGWIEEERPFLGICLGMQILFEASEEGGADGLGLLAGKVSRLPASVRVPHIGWNEVNGDHYYFDHSYAAHPDDDSIVRGWCDHGERFAAWVQVRSITAVQFHPEKSSRSGIALLERWLETA